MDIRGGVSLCMRLCKQMIENVERQKKCETTKNN